MATGRASKAISLSWAIRIHARALMGSDQSELVTASRNLQLVQVQREVSVCLLNDSTVWINNR
jgi:hypothetical protein